ncbi:DUF3558 domain-containing protein [Plantibacter cousiniae (nom. nud.)]|uniref:DUF3558 domain-containing protein n=1 Tax=Plantibacter cousiniae (nom. nud.) TaxID=199709 RepID=UPI001E54A19A|nr:DUF3558 domain-containing protein [Plantibacter cousiniae]
MPAIARSARVLTIAALLGVLAACSAPSSGVPTGTPTGSPPNASAALPPAPTSTFPGLACDALVPDAEVASFLGAAAAPQPLTVDDAPVLQDGGTVCAWADEAADTSLTVRIVGDSVDHWATFNHWYEHTDWSDSVGEINGTMCSDGACSVHALDGERFIEVDAAGVDDPAGTRTEELARAALAAAPVPAPAAPPSSAPTSRSCATALPVDTAAAHLGAAATGASYVSTATPSYHLVQDSLQRVGGLDCRLLSADSRELVRFTVLPGGAWVLREDSPVGAVDAAGSEHSAHARRGDDCVRLQAPGASEETTQALLAELLS